MHVIKKYKNTKSTLFYVNIEKIDAIRDEILVKSWVINSFVFIKATFC